MRVIKEIPHSDCKISIFEWNEKYLIKFETGTLEQTYKVKTWDILEDADLDKLVSGEFLKKVLDRFKLMGSDLHHTLEEDYE